MRPQEGTLEVSDQLKSIVKHVISGVK